jgi:lipase chaperone LimK
MSALLLQLFAVPLRGLVFPQGASRVKVLAKQRSCFQDQLRHVLSTQDSRLQSTWHKHSRHSLEHIDVDVQVDEVLELDVLL